MTEAQSIEWKRSWRDQYLRWICGFANAEGGTLVIGRDDEGAVVGVDDALVAADERRDRDRLRRREREVAAGPVRDLAVRAAPAELRA